MKEIPQRNEKINRKAMRAVESLVAPLLNELWLSLRDIENDENGHVANLAVKLLKVMDSHEDAGILMELIQDGRWRSELFEEINVNYVEVSD